MERVSHRLAYCRRGGTRLHLGHIRSTATADTGAVSADMSRTEDDGAPTTELVTSAVDDRCAHCRAPLASEQRYCVNCGARRGKPRFTAEALAAQTSLVPASVAEPAPPHRPRASPATTLVAGVATLLIAMGVGVLIGHNSSSTPTRAPAQQVITVGGGAGTATGPASSASTASSGGSKHSKRTAAGAHKTKVTVVHLTPKATKAAAAAATKVLGASAPKAPTVTQGQSCAAGTPGCSNGHFSGTFFGP